MEGKWLIILAMLASFLYKLYKKNKENQEENVTKSTSRSSQNSWGMEDLISEFQNKYGVETESDFDESYDTYQDEYEYDDVEMPKEEVIKEETKVVYSSETTNHHAFSHEEENEFDAVFSTEESVDEIEIDLRQMVISNTILTRPEY